MGAREKFEEDADGHRSRFSLQTLFIMTSLLCISLSLIVIVPIFGIPFSIVALLAWLRTVEIVRRHQARGDSVGLKEKARWFAGAFGYAFTLVAFIVVAVVAAGLSCLFAIVGLAKRPDPATSSFGGVALLTLFIALGAIFAIGKTWQYGDRVRRRSVELSDDRYGT